MCTMHKSGVLMYVYWTSSKRVCYKLVFFLVIRSHTWSLYTAVPVGDAKLHTKPSARSFAPVELKGQLGNTSPMENRLKSYRHGAADKKYPCRSTW